MITEKLRKAIANRAATGDEWDYGVQQSWKEILSIISESLDDIVDFVENDCTADEFSWLSEIYNEIIDVFPSKRIITSPGRGQRLEERPQRGLRSISGSGHDPHDRLCTP